MPTPPIIAAGIGKNFRLALIQLLVTSSKALNLSNARQKVLEASQKGGAQVVVLPECFNSPYGTQHFPAYSEPLEGGPTSLALSEMAKEAGVYLVGGSFPEKDVHGDKYYNTVRKVYIQLCRYKISSLSFIMCHFYLLFIK